MVIDNGSIRIDQRVAKAITDAGAIIVRSAPYSPELIPIESMFHSWKSYLKRHAVEFNSRLFIFLGTNISKFIIIYV